MLTLGALLVGGALLAFAALTLVFRRPEPPRWTARAGVGELVSIVFVTCLTFGIGSLVAGVLAAYQRGIDPIDLGLLVVVFGAALAGIRGLDVRRRLRAHAAAGRRDVATPPAPALELGPRIEGREPPAEPVLPHAA